MFDHDSWRQTISQRLDGFASNAKQEMQIAGAATLLSFLAARTVEPFFEAFQQQPVVAVVTLAEIARGPGADQIVRHAARQRFFSAGQFERELRTSEPLRQTVELLIVELRTLVAARQRLSATRDEWLRTTLDHELQAYPNELAELRRVLHNPAWQTRYEALRSLNASDKRYTPAELVLIHDGLADGAAHVRSAAVRALMRCQAAPPALLTKTLIRLALHDRDAETRLVAARTIGALRSHIASPQLIEYLATNLYDEDGFVRSAAALTLGQLGNLVTSPIVIRNLAGLLQDADLYTRETAVRALGQIGAAAATPEVITELAKIAESDRIDLHDAATDTLARLREARVSAPLRLKLPNPETQLA